MGQAQEITRALEGTFKNGKGLVRCPCHDDDNASLMLSDSPGGLRVHCFAGCLFSTVKDTLRRLGLLDGTYRPDPEQARRQADKDREERQRKERIVRGLWAEAGPVEGAALQYLREIRGYQGEIPPTLRSHPGLKHNGRTYPALLSAYAPWPGKTVRGLSRVFVSPEGLKVARTDLGTKSGACVRLCPAGPVLALTEGVEDGLSLLTTGQPTWAVGGVSGLYRAVLPQQTREVVIAADNDEPGRQAAMKAIAHWRQTGRKARAIWPPEPFKDWNDALKAGALGGDL